MRAANSQFRRAAARLHRRAADSSLPAQRPSRRPEGVEAELHRIGLIPIEAQDAMQAAGPVGDRKRGQAARHNQRLFAQSTDTSRSPAGGAPALFASANPTGGRTTKAISRIRPRISSLLGPGFEGARPLVRDPTRSLPWNERQPVPSDRERRDFGRNSDHHPGRGGDGPTDVPVALCDVLVQRVRRSGLARRARWLRQRALGARRRRRKRRTLRACLGRRARRRRRGRAERAVVRGHLLSAPSSAAATAAIADATGAGIPAAGAGEAAAPQRVPP